MNYKLFITISMLALLVLPANAYVVTEETSSSEYLINSGYSKLISDHVQQEKNRVVANPIDERKKVPWYKKILPYFDPAADDNSFMQHDTKFAPTVTDL